MSHRAPPTGAEVVETRRCDHCGEQIPVYVDPTPDRDGERRLASNLSGCPGLRGLVPNVVRRGR